MIDTSACHYIYEDQLKLISNNVNNIRYNFIDTEGGYYLKIITPETNFILVTQMKKTPRVFKTLEAGLRRIKTFGTKNPKITITLTN